MLYPYLQTGKLFVCPTANNLYGWTYAYAENWSPWVQPDGNLKFTANFGGTNNNASAYIPRMGQEKFNKDKVIYMDGRAGWFPASQGGTGNPIYTTYGSGTNVGRDHTERGVGRTDLLFIDGHVESLHYSVFSGTDVYRTWFRSDLKSTARVY